MSRWVTAALAALVTFAVVTGVSGAWVLPLLLTSEADRWVVAAGAGTAVSAVAVVWGERWVTRRTAERGPEPAAAATSSDSAAVATSSSPAPGSRSVEVKGDHSGVIVTGNDVEVKQQR